MKTRTNGMQRVLAFLLTTVMLLAMATMASATEPVTITGESKAGEAVSLMTISGVLGRPEEDYKRASGMQCPTYICSSDFAVEFSEACELKYCRIIGLEWMEAKQDPATFTFIEEGYNDNGKVYSPDGSRFASPEDGTEMFQFTAVTLNENGRTDITESVYVVIDDSFQPVAEPVEEAEVTAEEAEAAAPLETVFAKYTSSTVLINGNAVAFEAYNINDNNYFKLRDLAMALNGTEASFRVEWVEEGNYISIEKGSYIYGETAEAYVPVGGELEQGDGTDKVAYVSAQAVEAPMDGGTCRAYNNGEVVGWAAYNINDNNYFKLRDIGELFEFEVDWDGENNCIIIDTTKPYTED